MQERPAGYPIHWIFDYFDRFSERERNVALLLFDGKKVSEICSALTLTPEEAEECLVNIANKTGWGNYMRRNGIESGSFHRKWGFIHRKETVSAPADPMDDPMF